MKSYSARETEISAGLEAPSATPKEDLKIGGEAKASREREAEVIRVDGDAAQCTLTHEGATSPPAGCDAIVQFEVVPLMDEQPEDALARRKKKRAVASGVIAGASLLGGFTAAAVGMMMVQSADSELSDIGPLDFDARTALVKKGRTGDLLMGLGIGVGLTGLAAGIAIGVAPIRSPSDVANYATRERGAMFSVGVRFTP